MRGEREVRAKYDELVCRQLGGSNPDADGKITGAVIGTLAWVLDSRVSDLALRDMTDHDCIEADEVSGYPEVVAYTAVVDDRITDAEREIQAMTAEELKSALDTANRLVQLCKARAKATKG